MVLIAFDDRAAAERFYKSAAYRKILPLRRSVSKGSLRILDGVE